MWPRDPDQFCWGFQPTADGLPNERRLQLSGSEKAHSRCTHDPRDSGRCCSWRRSTRRDRLLHHPIGEACNRIGTQYGEAAILAVSSRRRMLVSTAIGVATALACSGVALYRAEQARMTISPPWDNQHRRRVASEVDFSYLTNAAFRQINLMAAAFGADVPNNFGPIDHSHDPAALIRGTKFERYWKEFTASRNREETYAIMRWLERGRMADEAMLRTRGDTALGACSWLRFSIYRPPYSVRLDFLRHAAP